MTGVNVSRSVGPHAFKQGHNPGRVAMAMQLFYTANARFFHGHLLYWHLKSSSSHALTASHHRLKGCFHPGFIARTICSFEEMVKAAHQLYPMVCSRCPIDHMPSGHLHWGVEVNFSFHCASFEEFPPRATGLWITYFEPRRRPKPDSDSAVVLFPSVTSPQ